MTHESSLMDSLYNSYNNKTVCSRQYDKIDEEYYSWHT